MPKGWDFQDNSKDIKKQMNVVSEAAVEAALLFIEAQAKALAPVGNTGELRDKIDHMIETLNNEFVGKVGSPLDIAVYVEYGTGEFAENGAGRKGGWVYQDPSGEWFFTYGQKPQPFIRPAFRNNKKQIERIIGDKYKSSFNGK